MRAMYLRASGLVAGAGLGKTFTFPLANGEAVCLGSIWIVRFMLISEFVAPTTAPVYAGPPPQSRPARLDALDGCIVEALRIRGRYGAGVWELIDALADAGEHESRAEIRAARISLWHRLQSLLDRHLIFRQGRKRISVFNLPTGGVSRRRRKRAGSTLAPEPAQHPAIYDNHLISNFPKQQATSDGTPPTLQKTHCADAPPGGTITDERREKIRHAASALARLRHLAKRPWSGFIGEQQIRRDQRIILADGRQVFAYGARKGRVVWSLHQGRLIGGLCGEPWQWGVVPTAGVKLAKFAAAVILGARKRGVREKTSERKRMSARRNGAAPARRGRRGRPPKLALVPHTG